MASSTLVLKEPKAESPTLIYLLFRFSNQRLKYSTGQKIHPKFWNEDSQTVRNTRAFSGAAELNTLLKNRMAVAHDIYRTLINDKQIPSLKNIKNGLDEVFKIPLENSSPKDFMGFIDHFISNTTKSPSTKKQYNHTFKMIKDFQEEKRCALTFDSIDLDFYDKFTAYLENEGYLEKY